MQRLRGRKWPLGHYLPSLHSPGLCNRSMRKKKQVKLPAIVPLSESFHQPPTILEPHECSSSCVSVTPCPEAPLLLDYLKTKAAGSEGLAKQEVTSFIFFSPPIKATSRDFSALFNTGALYNSNAAVLVHVRACSFFSW